MSAMSTKQNKPKSRGRPVGTTKDPTEQIRVRLKEGTVAGLTAKAAKKGQTLREYLETHANE